MIKRDRQFFEDRLADIELAMNADPDMNDNVRQILADSRAYCIEQIKYFEIRAAIIAAN